MSRCEALLGQFTRAVEKLQAVLTLEKSEVVRDSAILRFEIAMDLSWKLMKAFLEERHGIVCFSPKGCIREAFKHGRITYDDSWLDYVDLRNQTTHTYNENLAEELYKGLVEILGKFQLLEQSVRNKLS